MEVLIFAGGRGTRLMDETKGLLPKPLVPIAGKPIVAHVMDIYRDQGYEHFHLMGGFMWGAIIDWISGLPPLTSGSIGVADTGLDTQTGGRLARMKTLGALPTVRFMATYADGLADVNLRALIDHHDRMHEKYGALVTLTAVRPPSRWGTISIQGGMVTNFEEKPNVGKGWINGGFYVMEPEVVDLIPGDACRLEYDILPVLAYQNRLGVHCHPHYFQPMDTWRDLQSLEEEAAGGDPAWRRWRRADGH